MVVSWVTPVMSDDTHTHTRACPQTIVSLTHPLSPSSTMSDLGHVTMSACDPHVSVKDPVSPEHHRTHRLHTSVRVCQRPSVPRTSPDTQVTHFSPSLSKTQCPPNITGHTGHTLQSESVKDPVSPGHHRTHRLHTSVRACQRPSVPRTSPDTQVTHFSPSLSKTQCPPDITGHTGYTLQSESVKDPVSPGHHRTHRLHTSVRVCQRPSVPRTSPDTQVTHFSPSLTKTQCPPNITGHTGYTLQSESVKDPVSPEHHRTHRSHTSVRVKDPVSPEHHRTHRLHTSVRVCQRPSVPRTSPDTQVTHFSPSLSKTQCPPNITGHTGYTLQSESDKDPVSPGHHRKHRLHTSVRVCQRPSVPRTSPDTQVTHFSPSLSKTQCPPNITGNTGYTLQSESVKDPVSPEHHRTHRLHTSIRVCQRPSVPRTSPDTQVTHFSPSLSKTQCPPNITGHNRLHTSVRVCQRPSVLRTSPDTQVTHFSPSLSKTQCPPNITGHTGYTLQSESVKDPVSPEHHRTHRLHTSVRVCQRPSVPRTSPDTQVTHFSPSLSKTQCPPNITGHTGYTLQSESVKDPVSPEHHRTHRLHTSVRVCQRPSVPRTSPDTQVTHFSPSQRPSVPRTSPDTQVTHFSPSQRPSVPRTSPDTQVTHFSPSLSKTQCPPNITGHTGYTLQSESVKDPVSPEHHRTHRLHTSVRVCQRPSVPRTSPDTQVTHFSPSLSKTQCPPDITGHTGYTLQSESVKDPVSPGHHRTHRLHTSIRVCQRPSVPRTSPDTQVTHFSPSLSKTQCPPDITGHTGYTLQSESDKDPVSPEHHRTHRLHTSVRVCQRPSVPRTSPDTQVTHFSPSLSKTQCPPNITGHTGHTLQSESIKDPVSPGHHRTHRSHTSVRVCQRPSVPRTSPDTQVTHFSPSLSKTQCPPDITGNTGYTLQSESVKDPVSPEHHRTHRLHTSVRVCQRPSVLRTSPETQVTHFSPSLSKTQCPPNITGHTGYTLQSESVKDPVSPEHHRTHRLHTSVRVCQRPSVLRTSPDTQVTHFSPSLSKTQCPPDITGHTGYTLQSESVKDPVSPEHHRTHRLHTSVRVCQRPSVPRTSPDTQVTHFSPSLSKTQCPPNITGHTGYTLQSESVKDPVSSEHHRTHRLHTSVRVCQRPSVPRTSPDTQVTHFSPSLSKTQCPPDITGHTGYTLQSESVKARLLIRTVKPVCVHALVNLGTSLLSVW